MPGPSRSRWKLVLRINGGHRFFTDARYPGAIAVADQSGDGRGYIGRPDETDDGPLYLDTARPITVKRDVLRNDWRRPFDIFIPLRVGSPSGEQSSSPAGCVEALKLIQRYQMRLSMPYHVRELFRSVASAEGVLWPRGTGAGYV